MTHYPVHLHIGSAIVGFGAGGCIYQCQRFNYHTKSFIKEKEENTTNDLEQHVQNAVKWGRRVIHIRQEFWHLPREEREMVVRLWEQGHPYPKRQAQPNAKK